MDDVRVLHGSPQRTRALSQYVANGFGVAEHILYPSKVALMDRIENIKDQRDALDAENIKLQDMNDDLVISLNQITSTVNQINEWFEEV